MVEIPGKHPQGTIVMLTGELTRYAKCMQDLTMLYVPKGTGIVWHCGPSVKKNIDFGLNFMRRDPHSHWAWIMGDDHSFDPRVLMNLLDREVDCIAPLCMTRAPAFTTSLWRKGRNVPLGDLPNVDVYTLENDETYGDAGLLLRRNVVEKTGPPWQDHPQTGSFSVEDRIFVDKIRAAGFAVNVDLENVLGHITPCEILPEKRNGVWQTTLKFAGRRYEG